MRVVDTVIMIAGGVLALSLTAFLAADVINQYRKDHDLMTMIFGLHCIGFSALGVAALLAITFT